MGFDILWKPIATRVAVGSKKIGSKLQNTERQSRPQNSNTKTTQLLLTVQLILYNKVILHQV